MLQEQRGGGLYGLQRAELKAVTVSPPQKNKKKMLHELMNGAVIPFTFPRTMGIEKGKCFAIDVGISAKVF